MATRRRQVRDCAETFIVDFLRQHVPLDQQRSEWRFTFAEIDVAFHRYYFARKDAHNAACAACKSENHCVLADALQALCPNSTTGVSMIFRAHILAIGEFDTFTDSGTLFPPAFGPFRPPDDS